jgi:hypothetical protein
MATSERFIETPTGTVVGQIFEPFQILGIASYFTQSLNQSDGKAFHQETVSIEVPVGTVAIVNAQNLWFIGYGSLSPEPLDPLAPNHLQWAHTDHHLGLGAVLVGVVDISSPDFTQTPPKQVAELEITLVLHDKNRDDPWFGVVGYTLMFLGSEKMPINEERVSRIIQTRVSRSPIESLRIR